MASGFFVVQGCKEMNVQVIMREGQPEYAVLPWAEYRALLKAAAGPSVVTAPAGSAAQAEPLARLAALRESRGLSLEDLARSVGISPHYLAQFETGERLAEGPIARALARALGISGWEGAD